MDQVREPIKGYRLDTSDNMWVRHGLWVLILVLLVAAACNLPAAIQARLGEATATATSAPTPSPTQTRQPLPPNVIETNPQAGSQLPLDGSVTFYFNQGMDQGSVESAFVADPEVDGQLQWQDPETLVFRPRNKLAPDSSLTLTLGDSAKAANGLSLPEPHQATFSTPQYLTPTHFLPTPGVSEIDTTSAVMVTFNQPVVPLGQEGESDPVAFTLDPAVSGVGRWINTSTYLFTPQPALAGGVSYTALLNPELTGTSGAPLSEESQRSWRFSTLSPALVNQEPADMAQQVPLDAQLTLTFNQAMDKDSVTDYLSVVDGDNNTVHGRMEWSEDLKTATFVPFGLLKRGTSYTALLPGEARAAGGTPLGSDHSWRFRTVGELQLLESNPRQGYSATVYQGILLYFNSPLDRTNLRQHISIVPEVSNMRFSWVESDNALRITGDFSALQSYTLIISDTLSDLWGSSLSRPIGLNFNTKAFSPNLVIAQGTNDLFLTAQENVITAQGTNLATVRISRGTIPPDRYASVLGPNRYQALNNFIPEDNRSWGKTVNIPGDASYQFDLPLTPDGSQLPPGLYRYQVSSPQLPYNPAPYLVVISQNHLSLKVSPHDLLVWAVDLESGDPVQNTPVRIYSQDGEQVFSGETDSQGLFTGAFNIPRNLYDTSFYAVMGTPGEEDFAVSSSNWQRRTEPYLFSLPTAYDPRTTATYIYTDRPIYRPGQTVNYRIVTREVDEGGYALPEDEQIEVTVLGPRGKLDAIELALSSYATAHGQYTISEYAEPGYYRIESGSGQGSFQVAEYRKPEIDLDVTLSPGEIRLGQEIQASVNARYYFDAPAGNVDLSWRLTTQPSPFSLPGYQVGLVEDRRVRFPTPPGVGYQSLADSGKASTNREGKFSQIFQISGEDQAGREISHPAKYIFEVTIQDESGFPVSARTETLVHPSQFYIGLQPAAWISRTGERTQFEVKVVDWGKNPDGIRELKAALKKVTWAEVGTAPNNISYQRQYETVADQEFRTNTEGIAQISFVPPQPGMYQLDVFGEGARSEIMVWVAGEGQPVWPRLTNQRLSLVADQEAYQPGETAQVFIPNPFPEGGQALITLESDRIHSSSTVIVDGSGEKISLPLTEQEVPNVYLSVTLLGEDEEGTLDFRQGYLNLPVEPQEEILQVEVIGEPRRASPGDEATFDIRVTDQDANPVQGEFSLAVVDEAVLALADPNVPDIRQAFYGQRSLAVRLGLPISLHAGRELLIGEGIGGGGGGGPAVSPVRTQFPDTAYWKADITTDENGEARVSVPLPDNVTTWQALARGITVDSKVGQGRAEVITSKPLLVRPVTPRFLVAGDHLQLAAVVHNNTGDEVTAEVSMQHSGVSLDNPSLTTQSITIAAGGRKEVKWWIEVEEEEVANLVFSAQAGELRDAVQPYQGPLPILGYTAPRTYGTAGVMEEEGVRLEVIDLPRSFDPSSGSMEVELSPSLAAAMSSALEALEKEQHESSVGTMSHLLPTLAAYQALQQLELQAPELQGRLEEELPRRLEKVAAMQNEDGGWGWWEGAESNRMITSYLLFGLTQAQEAGVFVNQVAVHRAEEYLLAALPSTDMLTRTWQFDELAFQYFALSQAGVDDLSGAGNLFDHRGQLSPWGKALLALVLERGSPDSERVTTLFSDLEGTAVQGATGIHWEEEECLCRLNSTVTNSAIVTYALARYDPDASPLPRAVRYLISTRGSRGDWQSDYETAWAILALSEVMKATGELDAGFDYAASLNGTEIISGGAGGASQLSSVSASTPVNQLLAEEPNALEIERGAGAGRLYYRSHLTVSRPAADIGPYGNGMSLSRAYSFVEDGDEVTYTQHGSTNELIRVHLTLTLEEDTYYLKVKDTIPSGAEILDTRLKTSPQSEPAYHVSSPFREGWGWWYFNAPRAYDDHITWSANFVPAGTYQLTYTLALNLPGEYQVIPAQAWQTYFPEIQANSAGDEFIITAAQE